MNITAVIVTYNRLELLKLTIEKLRRQTLPLKHIIVVADNKSADGTAEFLREIADDCVVPLFCEANEGGAGGFYHGIKKAYALGSDYVWLMSDDTMTQPDALERLIEAKRILVKAGKAVGFISSNVFYKGTTPCFMNISDTEYAWNEFAGEGLVRVRHGSFVSMLIPAHVIREIGYPIRGLWSGDDEYSTRIAAKYEGYVCGKSAVYRNVKENAGVNIFNAPREQIVRFYYFYRDWAYTHRIRSQNEFRDFIRHECRNTVKAIKRGFTPYKKEKIKTVKKGVRDGKKFKAQIEYIDGSKSEGKAKGGGIKGKLFLLLRKFKHWLLEKDEKRGRFKLLAHQYKRFKRQKPSKILKLGFLWKGFFRSRIYTAPSRSQAFSDLVNGVKLKYGKRDRFVHSLDVYKNWNIKDRQMDNCAFEYGLIVNNGLNDLYLGGFDGFGKENDSVVNSLIRFADRNIRKLKKSNVKNKKNIIKWLESFKTGKAESLEDALQRICIVHQMLWQTGHILVGFGRLDYILDEIILEDRRSDEEIILILADFLRYMNGYLWYKSAELLGDTGQLIALGGSNEDGSYFSNRLTYLFIEALKRQPLPDPKILLRSSRNMPEDLLKKAVDCFATGVGSPLFSNDDTVIPALLSFGYEKGDAYNYATSACWEPIPGNCCEQNNLEHIVFSTPFDLVARGEPLSDIRDFEQYLNLYLTHLKDYSGRVVKGFDNIKWEYDPLTSALMRRSRETRTDVSRGAGKYNSYGILSVGLSNAVNSLLNIKRYVFDEKRFTVVETEEMRAQNFAGHEDARLLLKNTEKEFGRDSGDALDLTNRILNAVSEGIADYRNEFGGGVKFGTSSPAYTMIGATACATFDGRRKGEPFGVHLSADTDISYTELASFASELDYGGNRFNGNVLDLMLYPDLIKNNKEKFVDFVKYSIQKGIFQMQFNVLSGEILRKAKANPAAYRSLIVRVWGFSAYFCDLPVEYQDYLIERAEDNEHKRF